MNATHSNIYSNKTARWITLGLLGLNGLLPLTAYGAPPPIPPDISAQLAQQGTARVILGLNVPWQPEGLLRGADAVAAQRQQLATAQTQFITQLNQDLMESGLIDHANSNGQPTVAAGRQYETIPYVVMEVNSQTLPIVQQNALATSLELDVADKPALAQSLPLIGADKAWSYGYTGKGQTIAILDTGVETSHSFFATNRIVKEACFSTTFCPNGKVEQIDEVGAAAPCTYDTAKCPHGTHVAGIAASVAKDANLIAVQVFSKNFGQAGAFKSDQLLALEWLQKTYGTPDSKLAAVNLSLGDGKSHSTACDDDSRKKAIDNLRSFGIATIISSDNQGYSDGIAAPACISSAISVGATDKADTLWASSNSASQLNLLAPGVDIVSSVPGGQTLAMSGTSMAAPHVAGAWAVLKAAKPTVTVDELLTTLQSTGKAVTGKGVTKARVQLDKALSLPTTTALPLPTTTANVCDIFKDGLVLCLPFNGNANDTSGNANNGTVNGATLTPDRFGNANSAYQFDGKDDFIVVPDSPTLNPTHLTISVWVNSAHWHLGYVIDKDDGSYARQYIISAYQNFHAHQRTIDGGFIHYSNAGLSYGKWYHVVQTYDGQSLKLYIDGQYNPPASNSTTATSSGPGDNKVSQQPLRIGIGTLNGTPYFPFVGVIDDISIYNRALSDAEVQQLYAFSKKVTLFVAKTGNGQVTGNGVTCGTDCIDYLIPNAQATLTATANTGSSFTGWTGDCTGTNATVTVTMDKEKTCKANFELLPSYVATSGQGVNGCDVVKDGLVACYPFDSNANDTSGNGNNGTVNGAILTTDRFGNANGAYQFDGKDDVIVVPDSPTLNPTHLTISLWVNVPHWQGTYIIAKDRPYSRQYALSSDPGACFHGHQKTIDDGFTHYCTPIDYGKWQHVVQTYDGQSLKIYVDGQYMPPKDGSVYYGHGPGNTVSNEPVIIGASNYFGGQPFAPFAGMIDDIGIYNRALSEGEIRQLYAVGTKVTLTVTKTGNGQITGNGITCGADCTEDLAPNTQVTLTATATTGAMFKQWTGDCTGTTATVTVTMDKAKSCTATFELLPTYTLNVTKTGNGNLKGTGIDCGTDCTEANLAANTQVTLTATPDAGNQFAGWAGACTGTTTTTTVTLTADQTCQATFDVISPPGISLTVNKADTDRGTITARLRTETTASLTCGTTCPTASYNYPKDGVVILTATPDKGFVFKDWTCTGSNYTPGTQPWTLKLTMTVPTTCTANFDRGAGHTLTLTQIGTGKGLVTSQPAGLNCTDPTCTAFYATGQKVILKAQPSPFATFIAWGGDCTGQTVTSATLTLTKDLNCTVNFQSNVEVAAQQMVQGFYTDATTAAGTVATLYPQADNTARLQEAFSYAVLALLQADSHLAVTGQWPTQLSGLPWYAKSPLGQYTDSLQLQPGEYLDIHLKLKTSDGQEQDVVIVIYYQDQQPVLADSSSGRYSIPIWIPRSFTSQWGW